MLLEEVDAIGSGAALPDEGCRAVAPSAELRSWYRHDPGRFAEFAERYRRELARPEPERHAAGPVTSGFVLW